MFQTTEIRTRGAMLARLASFLVHCVVLFLWLYRAPVFVKPSSVAWGEHGRSETLVYLRRSLTTPQRDSKRPTLQLKAARKAQKEIAKNTVGDSRAGIPEGSLYHGPAVGSEARPALPMVFPDPAIYPWQLPKGLQGDVIVEVTIDSQGNVTETRVLQSLQQEIDDKVIATLRNWRFRPATVDGVAISSRQDVHFHFPS
jgi:TonB family protein